MNHPWLALLLLYLAVGFYVCRFARDEHGGPVPWYYLIIVVPFWPALFVLPNHDE